jgi:hypothetical protein
MQNRTLGPYLGRIPPTALLAPLSYSACGMVPVFGRESVSDRPQAARDAGGDNGDYP